MPNGWRKRIGKAALIVALVAAAPASAQLSRLGSGVGGIVNGLPSLPQTLPSTPLGQTLTGIQHSAQSLLDARTARLTALLRSHPAELDHDDQGFPTVRGEVLAIDPTPEALAAAAKLGFKVESQTASDLGFTIVTLSTPSKMSPSQALRQLRRADKQGQYDLNHVYLDAGEPQAGPAAPPQSGGGPPIKIGLIDTGANATHPALVRMQVRQQGFTAGGVRPADHGTAVAALAAAGRPGSELLVADVYGGQPSGGAVDAVVRALGWMGQQGAPVVNISLVGPPNLVLQAAVQALSKRGVLIVAAVGNDGPAAPPAYPASYPQVVAVTGVDGKGRLMLEAGQALHVDFAALGVDVQAAEASGGYVKARGTSFAAPVVAGRLAALHHAPGLDADNAVQALGKQARDLGPKGRDKTFGYGLIEPSPQ